MSADVFFHGTRAGFKRGGLLLPREVTGRAPTAAPLSPGRALPADQAAFVYVTRDREVAEEYARHAAGRGRPKVLTVRPLGPLQRDPEHGPLTDAWRCDAATVLAVEPLT